MGIGAASRPLHDRSWRVRQAAVGGAVVLGAASALANLVLGVIAVFDGRFLHDDAAGFVVWSAGAMVGVGATVWVWRRRPDHSLLVPFAVIGSLTAFGTLLGSLVELIPAARSDGVVAMTLLSARSAVNVAGLVSFLHIAASFPEGRSHRRIERLVIQHRWWLFAVVPLVAFAVPETPFPGYLPLERIPNPWYVGVGIDTSTGQAIEGGVHALSLLGIWLLATRYRHLEAWDRRRTRWLVLPILLVVTALIGDLLLSTVVGLEAVGISNAVAPAALAVGLGLGLVGPGGPNVDRVLSRSVAYAVLWLVIAAAYVGVSAGVGVVAGNRLPVEWAIGLTIVAAMVFQPARAWLEKVVDRRVFGRRADPTRLVARLGETLAGGLDLDTVLPRMSATLEEGLGLTWARVRTIPTSSHLTPPTTRGMAGVTVDAEDTTNRHGVGDGDDSAGDGRWGVDDGPEAGRGDGGGRDGGRRDEPTLRVPIEHRGEVVGVVECGPKLTGPLTDDDRAVVETLARQAGLAVGNVRLAQELVERADQLAESRTRLVRAQQAERRRIERDIHDGVQQDIVGLMAHVGALRQRDGELREHDLVAVHDGLVRLLAELRELAAGIHPSTLTDLGLLASVEALADRNPVPVTVRADESMRAERLPDEVAGVAYFTIAEALANSAKHAAATEVEVTLERVDGVLRISVADDGVGVDQSRLSAGQGLTNLTERVAALDGTFEVRARPDGGTLVSATIAVTSPAVVRGVR